MAAWREELEQAWDAEDRRARAGTTPCCGGADFVVIYREGELALVRCRSCDIDSRIRTH